MNGQQNIQGKSGSEIVRYYYYVENGKTTTWYVRDNIGNILSVYTDDNDNGDILPEEFPIYASSRIGTALADDAGNTSDYVYEITDHLGNVRATLGDDYYTNSTLLSYVDYYPMGMVIPGREKVASHEYRFGYQGQFAEKDGETGYNQFEARLYDSRIGRWMVFDPAEQYHSPYLGMGNNWSNSIDPNGSTSYTRIIAGDYYYDINDGSNAVFYAEGFTYHFMGYGYGGYTGNFNFDIPYFDDYITSEVKGESYINKVTLAAFALSFNITKYTISGLSDDLEYVDLTIDPSKGNGMENWHPGFDLYMLWKSFSVAAAKSGQKYLYHYTNKEAAENISKVGFKTKYSSDGFLYFTDKKNLTPLQSQIELALAANRELPTSLIRIKVTKLKPIIVRRVLGNRPGLGAGRGTEYLFNHNIPKDLIKVIK